MNQTSDAYNQLVDHIAGSFYDIANEGEPENDNLYETFESVARTLLDTLNVVITESTPLEASISLKR